MKRGMAKRIANSGTSSPLASNGSHLIHLKRSSVDQISGPVDSGRKVSPPVNLMQKQNHATQSRSQLKRRVEPLQDHGESIHMLINPSQNNNQSRISVQDYKTEPMAPHAN